MDSPYFSSHEIGWRGSPGGRRISSAGGVGFFDPHVTVERKKVDGRTPAESTSTKSEGWKYLPLDRDGVILPHNEPEEYPVREYLSVYAKGAATSSWVGQRLVTAVSMMRSSYVPF